MTPPQKQSKVHKSICRYGRIFAEPTEAIIRNIEMPFGNANSNVHRVQIVFAKLGLASIRDKSVEVAIRDGTRLAFLNCKLAH